EMRRHARGVFGQYISYLLNAQCLFPFSTEEHVHMSVSKGTATRRPAGGKATRAIAGLLLGAISIAASAAQGSVATETRSHDVRGSTHIGEMRAGEQVHIVVALRLRSKPELDALTAEIMRGARQPLSSAEFQTRYAPSADQVQAVVAYLRQQG